MEAKENVSADTADVTGTVITRIDSVRVGDSRAVDSMMGVAEISVFDPASVAATVLVAT